MQRNCDRCGLVYGARSARSRFCSVRCRTAATRARQSGESESLGVVAELPSGSSGGPVELATRARLEAAERLESPLGQGALSLARLVDASHTPPSAVAGLVRELRVTLEAALDGAARAPDLVDELKARRERRRRA